MSRPLPSPVLILGLLAIAPGLALAEPPPAPAPSVAPKPAPASPASPPDVVKLKDGSLLRGTIVELKAKEFVQIQLLTGEVRRLGMDQVEYAGPANGMKLADSQAP